MSAYIANDEFYTVSKNRKVLLKDQLRIPGLYLLGYQARNSNIDHLDLHYHNSFYEITIVVEGLFDFQLDGEDYRLTGGDILIVAPNVTHSSNFSGEFYWFQINIQIEKDLLFLNEEATADLVNNLKSFGSHIVHMKDKSLFNHFKKMLSTTPLAEKRFMVAGFLHTFLHSLFEAPIVSTSHTFTNDIERSVDYILAHFKEDISLEQLAAYCNLSPSQFKYKFKYQMGISPRYFINLTKIEHAKKMLLQGKSKTAVATELNFSSSAYFSSVFKKFTSLTPSEFCAVEKR